MTSALTPKFAAMNGRDKWETLVLSGLIGTDEPWIAAMTATLREEATERQSLSDRIVVLEGALERLVGCLGQKRVELAGKDLVLGEARHVLASLIKEGGAKP